MEARAALLIHHSDPLSDAPPAGGSRPEQPIAWVVDTFAEGCPPGRLDGTRSDSGHSRLVTDEEGVIGIDHGALRIGQMIRPGWGRFGVAYGPIARRPGVVAAAFLVNGHNLSQAYTLKTFGAQVRRWMRGSGAQPLWRQVLRGLLWHRPRESHQRRLRRWWLHRRRPGAAPELMSENLAVGFFGERAPVRPLASGNALLVRAAEGFKNGQLCVGIGGRATPAFDRLQNVQVLYIVILRERGAAYYVAGPPGAHAVAGFPSMRPVGIDALDETPELFAGVHQGVLGEIGFAIDSRVFGVKIGELPDAAAWFGMAQAADALIGSDSGALGRAEIGGSWRTEGTVMRGPRGASGNGRAWLTAREPAGLLHALIEAGEAGGGAALEWRASGRGDQLRLEVKRGGALLLACRGDREELLARDAGVQLASGEATAVQVLDDGDAVTVAIGGEVAFGGAVPRPDRFEGTGVGFGVSGGWAVRQFECHAREVPIPAAVRIGEPWTARGGGEAVRDEFGGAGDLHGRAAEHGKYAWERTSGRGVIEATGNGFARVRAAPGRPAPGRTIYTVGWDNPDFVDVEVELTPPGTGPGQQQKCRSGLCLWQDPRNYVIVNIWLDDTIETTSVSSFFFVRGFEDIYDAAWTNVGARHAGHGRPMRLRIVCDGRRYHALVNDEPVLYRGFADIYPTWERLKIHRVGLATNWEWGNDTGTQFRSFVARDER